MPDDLYLIDSNVLLTPGFVAFSAQLQKFCEWMTERFKKNHYKLS